MGMVERIRDHIESSDAEGQLQHYLEEGAFSGASFEKLGGRGDAPDVANRFTAEDLVAVTTLSVSVSGWGAIDLLSKREKRFSKLLEAVPRNRDLHKATDADLESLWTLQSELDTVQSVGHVTRSKLLARKRPKLVPVRDQHVLRALTGGSTGSFTLPLRDALRADGIVPRLNEIREAAGAKRLSLLRVLDIVVWMRTHGAASVA